MQCQRRRRRRPILLPWKAGTERVSRSESLAHGITMKRPTEPSTSSPFNVREKGKRGGRARVGAGNSLSISLSLSLSLSPATIGPAPKSTLAISSTPVSSLVSAHCSVDSARSKERHSRFVEIPCSGHRLVPFLLWNAIAALQIHGCVDHRPPLAKRLEKGSSSWNVHPSSISFYRKAAELPEFSYGL